MSQHKLNLGRAFRLGVLELVLLLLGMVFVHREIWEFHASSLQIEHWQTWFLLPAAFIDGTISGLDPLKAGTIKHKAAYEGKLKWGSALFMFLYVACGALCERLSVCSFTFGGDVWRSMGVAVILVGIIVRCWAHIATPNALLKMSPLGNSSEVVLAAENKPDESVSETAQVAEVADREKEMATESATEMPTESATAPAETLEASKPVEPAQTEVQASQTAREIAGVDRASSAPEAEQPIVWAGPYKLVRHPDTLGQVIALCGLPLVFNCWLPLLILPGVLVLLKWHISDQEAFRISQLGQPYLDYKRGTWNLIPCIY